MEFDRIFGYVTGAVSVLSFVLLLIPYFAKYKVQLTYAFVFFAGLCAGAVVARFSPSSVSVSFEGTLFQGFLVVGALASLALAFLVIVTSAISNEIAPVRMGSGSAAFGVFLVCAVMFGLSSCQGPDRDIRLATGELLTLSSYYEGIGNVEAAVGYLERAIASENRSYGKETELQRMLVKKMSSLLAQRPGSVVVDGKLEKIP